MSDQTALDHARHAFKQGNLAAMHTYYALCLSGDPNQGVVFDEFLQRSRSIGRGQTKWVDVAPDGAFKGLLPSQSPAKILDAALERLRSNPFDLDAIHKVGKTAVTAGWHSLATIAVADVLKNSPTLRAPTNKLRRELKMTLGREHYALKEFQAALDALQEFQNDPAAPKDVLQTIKDAAATIASESFSKRETAFNLATKQSDAIATRTAKEREEDEAGGLEALINDPNAEPAKAIAAVLRLSEMLARSQQFERALSMIAEVESRTGHPADLAKKSVEIALRKRSDQIDKLRRTGKSVTELEAERDEFALSSYSQLLKKIPTDGDVRLILGEALVARWKRVKDESILKDAIVHFQFDFKTDELAHRARLRLAESFLDLELPGAAEVVLTDFLSRLDATKRDGAWFIEAQYLLGVVRERLEDARGATAAFLAVIGKDIRFKDAYERLKVLEIGRRNSLQGYRHAIVNQV